MEWWLSKRDSELKDLIKTVEGEYVDFDDRRNLIPSIIYEKDGGNEFIKGRNQAIDDIISKIKELL